MQLKKEIYYRIRTDKTLRRKVADALAIEPESVYRLAIKGSRSGVSPKLNAPVVIAFIAKAIGQTTDSIIERELS